MQEIHYDRSTFSKNLCRLMDSHHMSAAELSRLIGVSPSTVSEWRKGKKAPRWNKLEQIAALFHVSKSELIEGLQTKIHWVQGEPYIGMSAQGEDLLRLNGEGVVDLNQNLREKALTKEGFIQALNRAIEENGLQNDFRIARVQDAEAAETEIRSAFADERTLKALQAMENNSPMQELIHLFLDLSGEEQQALLELVHLYVEQLRRRQHSK